MGITEFISQGRQIPAITKYLLSDFIVNEIDKNEQVVYLKNKPSAFVGEEKPVMSFEMTEELKKSIAEALGSEAAEHVEKLYEQLDSGEKISPWEFVI